MADENQTAVQKALGRVTRQEIEHAGHIYEINTVADYIDAHGCKTSKAIEAIYPELTPTHVKRLTSKVNKHPYFLARKDASLAILKQQGPNLQQNALDLAFNARSEMVRADMTKDSLNRIYGDAKDATDTDDKPVFVFNFNMGGSTPTVERTVIDADVN